MTTLLIPPAVWLLLLATLILFSFIAFAIGTPGTGRIKTTMNAALVSWGTSYILQAFIFSFEATQLVPPPWLFMAHTISVLLLAPLWGEFYYAILERKTGAFLVLVRAMVFVSSVLAIVVDLFHQDERSRYALIGVNVAIGFAGFTWQLVRGYRTAAPNSMRKKRIFIVLSLVILLPLLIYVPVQVIAGQVMQWLTDQVVVASVVSLMVVTIFVVGFHPLITRYNLVQVQLDKVGEGLFRDIDSAVFLLSQRQHVLRANPRARELFDLDGLMNQTEDERHIGQLLPDFTPSNNHFDVVLDTRVGPKEFECSLSNVYQLDEVIGSILVFHDMTRERELARMKTEFTSTVSHELRTPLTSILGFAKLIQRRFHTVIMASWTPETKKETRAVSQISTNLEVIISEGQRLTKLINDVLDISKMEAGKVDWNFARCAARSIIDQAINATSGLFDTKPSVALVQDIPDELPELVADSDRVVQVVINLLSNAVKFTDFGRITVQVATEGSSLIVRVQDQGTGISESDQKLVFEKYKQVGDVITDKPTGTGLGLPISKEIVEMHGGRIWVESTPGEGSTFSFSLPLATVVDPGLPCIDDRQLLSELETGQPASAASSTTVLVVDDDASVRELVCQMLQEAGYQTVEAADGIAGLQSARSAQPDVIILDVMMPRLNGFDCAAALKADAACRHIPILMLTVIQDAQRAYGLGIEGYVTKPFAEAHLLSEVRRLLDRRTRTRQLVVLGSTEDSRALVDRLEATSSELSHVEDLTGLQAALTATEPDMVLVVAQGLQTPETRSRIQQMVGPRPCLVLYIQPEGATADTAPVAPDMAST